MRSTHTYVILELSPAAHAEIMQKMRMAGYQHAIEGGTIDMHGIAVETEMPPNGHTRVTSALRDAPPELAGVTVDGNGQLHGATDDIESFKEFCRSRPLLLADVPERATGEISCISFLRD